MVYSRWNNPHLSDFIEEQREGFFSNQVVKDYEAYDGKKIPKGMKLVKAFKFFESNQRALEDIQSAASMIIQEDKVEGKLCVSVHPLDFLSISENTHNWRSCHALDGDYRSGNLSYMVDESTVICYLKSEKDEKLPNFPSSVKWNSKKWRVLLFFSNDWNMIFAGRQYPFQTSTGLDFIKDKILVEVFKMGHLSNWTDEKIKSFMVDPNIISVFKSPYLPIGNTVKQLSDIVVNMPGSLQFNDLLSSSCYEPYYCSSYKEHPFGFPELKTTDDTIVKVGGQVNCCRCGHRHIQLSESFMCNDCEIAYGTADVEEISNCPCCGNRFYFDDGYFVTGTGETICPNCAEEYTDTCEECGDLFFKDELIFDGEKYICKWCKGDL